MKTTGCLAWMTLNRALGRNRRGSRHRLRAGSSVAAGCTARQDRETALVRQAQRIACGARYDDSTWAGSASPRRWRSAEANLRGYECDSLAQQGALFVEYNREDTTKNCRVYYRYETAEPLRRAGGLDGFTSIKQLMHNSGI